MFKLYRRSQEVQYAWIKNHPVQYVALNATLLGAMFLYWHVKDRQFERELDHAIDQLPQS